MNPERLGLLRDEATRGVGAETLQRTLGPSLDAQLENLLNQLTVAPPQLDTLLDLRAQIKSVRNIQKDLRDAITAGKNAGAELAKPTN